MELTVLFFGSPKIMVVPLLSYPLLDMANGGLKKKMDNIKVGDLVEWAEVAPKIENRLGYVIGVFLSPSNKESDNYDYISVMFFDAQLWPRGIPCTVPFYISAEGKLWRKAG